MTATAGRAGGAASIDMSATRMAGDRFGALLPGLAVTGGAVAVSVGVNAVLPAVSALVVAVVLGVAAANLGAGASGPCRRAVSRCVCRRPRHVEEAVAAARPEAFDRPRPHVERRTVHESSARGSGA